jgi:hypothetical protein
MFSVHLFGQKVFIPEEYVNMLSTFVIVTSSLFLFAKLSIPSALPIAFFITCLVFAVGGRPSFVMALTALVFTMFFVIFKKDVWAENAAIVVYYMLLSGVVLELLGDKLHKLYASLSAKLTKKFHA